MQQGKKCSFGFLLLQNSGFFPKVRYQMKKQHWKRLLNDLSSKSHIYREQCNLEAFRELAKLLICFSDNYHISC